MKVTILKSDSYVAIFEDFIAVPVIANSQGELKKQVVNEVYRTCNFLEKRLPKNANEVEILKTVSVKESVKNLDENLFYIGFSKKAFSEYKTLFIQSAFSLKAMVDSLKNGNDYLKNACSLINGVICLNGESGIIETAFTAVENLEELFLKNELLAYKRIVKLCYLLTSYALNVYSAEKQNGAQDIFYFD